MVNVRKVLESSEHERLKERKEKLSSIQSMIKLTKEKSYLEEELEIRKKTDTKEGGDKVSSWIHSMITNMLGEMLLTRKKIFCNVYLQVH